jgi:hypothetical protein
VYVPIPAELAPRLAERLPPDRAAECVGRVVLGPVTVRGESLGGTPLNVDRDGFHFTR